MEYKLAEIHEISTLSPATQIAVRGLYANINPSLASLYPLFSSEKYYYHHGVYLGNGKVAHIAGENKADAKPCICDLHQFWKGALDGKLYRVEFHSSVEILPVEKTLTKAQEVLADPSKWPGYQLHNNNCETFATWLTTGIHRSAQVTQAVSFAVNNAIGSLERIFRG
ncbi:Hypothetical predicted protein [Paramuricea clavata]|uniref:Uncharacterized protein n=1 Tax=Paramuricea clavata TaxID=317549 RepID=A0A6S7GMH1_PARCT|nr:Hypothetical predicted protein [Paramuricea clavata]